MFARVEVEILVDEGAFLHILRIQAVVFGVLVREIAYNGVAAKNEPAISNSV